MLSPYASWVLESILPKKTQIISSQCEDYIENSIGLSSISGSPVTLSASPAVSDKEQVSQVDAFITITCRINKVHVTFPPFFQAMEIILECNEDVEPFLRVPSVKMLAVESKIHLFEEEEKAKSRVCFYI